jgi:hypothetical protein
VIKGVPSIINDLRKVVYSDPEKRRIVGEVLEKMLKMMEQRSTLSEEDAEEQDPTVLLWLYYFNSQH